MMKAKSEKKSPSPADKAKMDSLRALRKMAMEMIKDSAEAGLGEESPTMAVMTIKKKKGMIRPDMDASEEEEAMGPEALEDYAEDMENDEEYDADESESSEESDDLEEKLRKLMK